MSAVMLLLSFGFDLFPHQVASCSESDPLNYCDDVFRAQPNQLHLQVPILTPQISGNVGLALSETG
jgi:hypothetical protein